MRASRRATICCWLALLAAPAARARETAIAADPGWMVDRFLPADGLPLDHLNGLALDRAGYLWIATFDGLSRFDGHQVRTWRRADLPGVRSNRFVDAALDASGRMLVHDETGVLARFDPRRLPLAPEILLEGGVLGVGRVGEEAWARGDWRVWRIGERAAEVLRLPETPEHLIQQVGAGPEGELLVQTRSALHRVWPDGRTAGAALTMGDPDASAYDVVPAADAAGRAWAARGSAVLRIVGGVVEPAAWEGAPPGAICELRVEGGAVIAHTEAGFWRSEGGALRLAEPLPPAECGPSSLASGWRVRGGWLWRGASRLAEVGPIVSEILDDGAGGLWASTHRGLLHVRPAIARAILGPSDERRASDAVVLDGRGGWWASLQGRTVRWDGDELIGLDPLLRASSLRALGDGSAAIVSRDGLHRLGPAGAAERLGPLPEGHLFDPGCWGRIADGAEWLAAQGALLRREPGGAWAEVRDAAGASIPAVRDVVGLPGGRLVVLSGQAGLLVGPPGSLRRRELPSLDLRSARFDGSRLWIGTEDVGLCWLDLAADPDPAAAPLRCVSEADGLGDHNVHHTLDDGLGRLWLGTNRGVLVVSRDALARGEVSSVRIDERDGMVRRETNGGQWSVARDADGRLWVPTMAGPVALDPALLPAREGLVVQLETETTELDPGSRELRARWSTPEHVRPEQVRFRYRLEGVDAGWRGPDAAREATWTNVPAGDHALVVQAALGGGWGPEARLAIHRRPTFFETPLFPGALMLAAAAATAGAAALWGRQRRRREAALEAEVARRTAELREQKARLEAQSRQLAEVDAAKTRFVANLSHELRTPLMLVMAPLQDLAADAAPGPAAERARLAARNAERLRDLVDQLFDVVRLDAGRMPMRARRVDLGAFLRDLAARFQPVAEARGVALSARLDAPAELWADPDLLEKAASNLLSNALKLTPAGGRVGVELIAGEREAIVRVWDDGPGVPPEARDRIFDRFYQADEGDGRRAEGAGLGLALAREIAELHGGSLRLAPAARGACFELALPAGADHLSVADIALDAPALPPDLRPAAPREGGRRVLIVEDHAELRAYLCARLGEEFAVEAAPDGEAALRRLREAPPVDLLLSDVMMPGLDGLALCRAVRADPALAALPVVLLSAKGRAAEPEARAAGADAFVPKPVRVGDLLAELRARLPPAPAEPTCEEAGPRTEADAALLARIEEIARRELRSPEFSVEILAKRVAMSPRTLQRALNRLSGKAPTAWLQEMRLEAGREALRRGLSVGDAAAEVGLSPSYFARLYRAWFGYPPSEEPPP